MHKKKLRSLFDGIEATTFSHGTLEETIYVSAVRIQIMSRKLRDPKSNSQVMALH